MYIGIDLGTSAVKLLLVESGGKILNEVSKEYPVFYPHTPVGRSRSPRIGKLQFSVV